MSFTYRGNLVVSPLGSPPGPLFASCAYVLLARAVHPIGFRTVDRAVEATRVGERRVIACIFVGIAFYDSVVVRDFLPIDNTFGFCKSSSLY